MLVNRNALRSASGIAADELPAHQRMQFGILVDRPVDGEQQAGSVERVEMIVQIAVAALRPGGGPLGLLSLAGHAAHSLLLTGP